MTINAIYDELVPSSVSHIEGVKNVRLLIPEHTLAILTALVFPKMIVAFIQDLK